MDLRGKMSSAQIDRTHNVWNWYQPFIFTDDIQTGAAYSWVYRVNVTRPRLVFERRDFDAKEWDRISDANARLRRMYDDFVSEIARHYPGGSLLDFACANGYFPVKAELCGMRGFGTDAALGFERSVELLNDVLGTRAEFVQAHYDPRRHLSDIEDRYTVVSASAIMCHLPDPLHFLAYLGSLATDAVFFFGQAVDTDALLISYLSPHPDLGAGEMPFPYRFNDNTRLSKGLLFHGFEQMGFKNIVELPWRDEWLSPYFDIRLQAPSLEGENRIEVRQAWKLRRELDQGSTHIAVLAMR
jgi:hypothetical protein